MKKGKLFFFRFFGLSVLIFVFLFSTACGVNTGTLSEEKTAEIERLYCERYPEIEDPITEMNYLGNYNGYDAILIKFSFIDGIRDAVVTVDGVEVGIFPPAAQIDVYDETNKSIESISEAYENGKIDKNDLKKMKKVCEQKGYSKKEVTYV